MNALARAWRWAEEAPVRLTPSVVLRVLPAPVVPAPPLPGWRPWKPVVLPGFLPILNAFSIVQHQTQTGTSDAAGNTTSVGFASNTTAGNLLTVAITFRGSATTTGSAGWTKAATITNGSTCQTEIWYAVAAGTDPGPAFVIAASVSYAYSQVEIAGFTGTPTLDRTGTATGSGVNTLATAVSSTITAASEFVFGGCGDRQGNTAGITWNASTASGSATFGADIDAINPPKNGEGVRDAWATSGASGTSPSITFNLSASTNTTLAACIVTFKSVAAANVYLPPRGTNYSVTRGSVW